MVELSGLTLPQLYQLQKDLEREISHRKVEERQRTLSDLQKLAAERGFSLGELVSGAESGKRAGGKRGPVAAQFKNPADANQTWTGRGRKPQWVNDFLAKGGQLEELRI